MYSPSRDAYFETQINTATPQKLRLMLIDGAIRLARQTGEAWERGYAAAGLEALIRCREILGELLAGIRQDDSPLSRQVSSLYVFLLQTLTSTN